MSKPTLQNQSESTPPPDNFYEAMPMFADPHSVYRDDVNVSDDQASSESTELAAKLTALITLAGIVLLAVILILAAVYTLGILNDSASAASLNR